MSDPDQRLPKSFLWLNTTQFLGALNDNLFKFFLVFSLIGLHGQGAASRIQATAGAVFVVPFLLFIAAAGVVADRYSKRQTIVMVKAWECVVMSLGVLSFFGGFEVAMYAVLFLMAMQSAVFGPSKYGIVPELVGRERLSRANGFLQAFTYLAIIIGTALAPFLADRLSGHYGVAAIMCVLIAVAGFFASLRIEHTPPANPEARFSLFFLREIWRSLRSIRHDGFLVLAVVASAYFLMIAAFMQLNIIPFGIQSLGLDDKHSTYLFILAALGIGAGAITAGHLSGRNIEFGIVPVGALGLAAGNILLFTHAPSNLYVVLLLITLVGVSAGIFIVPINAFIQFRSPRDRLGEILAASSFLSWVGVLVASGMLYLFSEVLELSAREGYLIVGLITLGLTLVTFVVLPDFFTRFVVVCLARLVYRIRVRGVEHVPVEGPALLVANHASWIDPIIIVAAVNRRIRFLMARSMYERMVLLRPLLKLAGVIPVSGTDSRSGIQASIAAAREQLDNGFIVCVFAEGAISRSGMMLRFKSGFTRIVQGAEYPLIPVYLGGAWGSIFSYYHGKIASRLPNQLPYPISIIFGEPVPPDISAESLRIRVQELSVEFFDDKKPTRKSLPEMAIHGARHNWSLPALADTTGKNLTFGQALTGAVILADKLETQLGDAAHVAILLPASVGGALANVSSSMLGKIPVNLNFTASAEAITSAMEQCGIQTAITSRAFLGKIGTLPLPPHVLYLEDLLKDVSAFTKASALARARWAPASSLIRARPFLADDVATVIFSSGSTGTPKGIMLSHHNILSNIEAANMLLRLESSDRVCGTLPFFHAFGYTINCWLPWVSGIGISFHPNPLEAGRIARMVREERCTLLVATPTFLLGYIRKAEAVDFASVRHCIVGAEKLKPEIAEAFEAKFGLRPLEGYGATELSPLAACNVPDVSIDGVTQVGQKPGTVGHPLPGVAMKVVDPDTGDLCAENQPGLLLVKGPNVMLGYLGEEVDTANVIQDGWYVTGDIVRMDRDGFITITDRLSRFSKIGGEMVPHIAVEDALQRGIGVPDRVVAVTAVPDARRGERLIVLYQPEAGDPSALHRIVQDSDLPNLWRPARDAYMPIDTIPMLGSGKLDIKGLRTIAESREA